MYVQFNVSTGASLGPVRHTLHIEKQDRHLTTVGIDSNKGVYGGARLPLALHTTNPARRHTYADLDFRIPCVYFFCGLRSLCASYRWQQTRVTWWDMDLIVHMDLVVPFPIGSTFMLHRPSSRLTCCPPSHSPDPSLSISM